jgi:hypothetical protein
MKPRYNLSPEGMDRLMDRLTMIAMEGVDSEAVGLMEAQITTGFVKTMTKVKGLDDVIERNEQLSKSLQGFLTLYGFTSMYDMYLYAMSCDLVPEGLNKSKDYSKLVPVKRKIIRNGKETEVTVYENPNKDKEKDDDAADDREVQGARYGHARELKRKVHGDKEPINPKKVAQLKLTASKLLDPKKFKDTSDYYLELTGEGNETIGIIGFSERGEYLVMDFYQTNGQVPGIAARGFSELVKLALSQNKGVQMEDQPQARPVFVQFGLQQEDSIWSVSAEDLQDSFGEFGKLHE